MTSTNGVTLISAIGNGGGAPCAGAAAGTADAGDDAHQAAFRSSIWPRQDRRELVGEALHAGREPRHLRGELVVEDDRGDGGEKAKRGCKQRLGDARRDDREVGVAARRQSPGTTS